MVPASVIGGTAPYPDSEAVNRMLTARTGEIFRVPATEICRGAGNPRALNMVMLGALSAFLELGEEAWFEDLRSRVPSRFVESSLEAFSGGASCIGENKKVKGS